MMNPTSSSKCVLIRAIGRGWVRLRDDRSHLLLLCGRKWPPRVGMIQFLSTGVVNSVVTVVLDVVDNAVQLTDFHFIVEPLVDIGFFDCFLGVHEADVLDPCNPLHY